MLKNDLSEEMTKALTNHVWKCYACGRHFKTERETRKHENDTHFTETMAVNKQVVNELSEIDTRIPLLEQKLKQTEIRSPSDGIINSLPVSEEETVIKTGEIIAEIVPSTDNLIVEAFIDPKDIAKIEVSQEARVSLTAYDAAKYGYLIGRLLKVSADAVYREEKQSYMYAIEVELINNLADSKGSTVPLNPGMIAQVDIIRGQQTVLEYFWQPIAKLKDDAFRQ